MNQHSLQVLDFQRILEIPAEDAQSAPGRRRILSYEPLHDADAIRERQSRIAEMSRLVQEEPKWPALNLGDPDAVLEKLAAEGVILEPVELIDLAKVCEVSVAARRVLGKSSAAERFPGVCRRAACCWDDDELPRRIRSAFDARGELLDDASPALRRLRRRLTRLRQETSERAEKLLHAAGRVPEGVENFVTLRLGRYVLAVPSDRAKRVPGILHDRSSTGRTHIVEPLELVEANNALTDVETREREEVRRILREFTEAFRARRDTLTATAEALGEIDAWAAVARWMNRSKGTLPRVDPEVRSLRLVGVRHPLLCKALGSIEGVVPLNLELGPDLRCVVVSGPNMGGKSVLLKTAGACVAMGLAGLAVLGRDGTELPLVDDILVDIGDEQSMESDLSTFAGHLRNLRRMDERATARTLLLIDELGSGTDPQEGAALGLTLLSELHGRGGFTLVTTHMSAFKDFAARTPKAGNGSMEFDPDTLRPKYRFLPGVPGRSHAFEVAALQGWPRQRIQDAGDRLEESSRRSDALLRELEEQREESARRQEEMAAARADLEDLKGRHKELIQKTKARLDNIRMEKLVEEDRALGELRILRSRLQKALADSETDAAPAAAQMRALLSTTDAALRRPRIRRRRRSGPRAGVRPDELSPGQEVWCNELGANVTFDALSSRKGRVWVRAGPMRVEVHGASLSKPDPSASTGRRGRRPVVELPTQSLEPELDLRGLDRAETQQKLDQYFDRASLQGLSRVRIIHGVGRGILKREVARFLGKLETIDSFRDGEPGEGGAGVTIAFFKTSKG